MPSAFSLSLRQQVRAPQHDASRTPSVGLGTAARIDGVGRTPRADARRGSVEASGKLRLLHDPGARRVTLSAAGAVLPLVHERLGVTGHALARGPLEDVVDVARLAVGRLVLAREAKVRQVVVEAGQVGQGGLPRSGRVALGALPGTGSFRTSRTRRASTCTSSSRCGWNAADPDRVPACGPAKLDVHFFGSSAFFGSSGG